MISDIKVSIIMPVYNAKNYIEVAITSIIKQTYKNFELIIIDDGSTDGTANICKKFAKYYNNVRYYKQNNLGTCAARNKGIELATGEYIAFSDHDDEYISNYLEVLVGMAENNNLDIVKCGVYYEEAYSNGIIKCRKESFKQEIVTQNELVERYNDLPISYFGVWNSLYKTSILRDNNIRFPVEIRHGQEDYFFNTEIIPFIKKIGFSEKCLYRHFRRISQSTSTKFYQDRIEHMSLYFEKECEILQPLINKSNWKVMYSVLYARKITGVLSYVFNTTMSYKTDNAVDNIKFYLDNTPYLEKLSVNEWVCLIKSYPKYALVLFLSINQKYRLLISFWGLKNK